MTDSHPNPMSTDPVDTDPVDAEIVEPASTPAPPAAPPAPDYDEHGVPSLDYVRDKIEGRWATATGAQELAADTPRARSLEQQEADREKAAKSKLDEIRRSLG